MLRRAKRAAVSSAASFVRSVRQWLPHGFGFAVGVQHGERDRLCEALAFSQRCCGFGAKILQHAAGDFGSGIRGVAAIGAAEGRAGIAATGAVFALAGAVVAMARFSCQRRVPMIFPKTWRRAALGTPRNSCGEFVAIRRGWAGDANGPRRGGFEARQGSWCEQRRGGVFQAGLHDGSLALPRADSADGN